MAKRPQVEEPHFKLTAGDEKALDDACDKVGAEALAELGLSPQDIREMQARKLGDPVKKKGTKDEG